MWRSFFSIFYKKRKRPPLASEGVANEPLVIETPSFIGLMSNLKQHTFFIKNVKGVSMKEGTSFSSKKESYT